MNLKKKKLLAMRTFGVGDDRIFFVESRLNEIKEAITKQDIRDLVSNGAIIIKPVKGTLTKVKYHKKKTPGNVRKKAINRKRDYMHLTRKLRKYLKELKQQGRISNENFKGLRKKIRNKEFKSLNYLKIHLKELK
jgi:large subunit ribosomal protein L19e